MPSVVLSLLLGKNADIARGDARAWWQTPDVAGAYEDVRNDKTETNWLYLSYEGETDKIQLRGTGSGGLAEFVSQLKDNEAGFGYLRMVVGNDQLSKRSKFVLVSWCGPTVKVMRKAKLSVHISDVKQVVKAFAIELQATNIPDLKEDAITLKLKKAMGANYDRQTSEY